MKILLSLPKNMANSDGVAELLKQDSFFATSDPKGMHIGSGAGSSWLLTQCWNAENQDGQFSFEKWLSKEKRILVHAGGQSRRLPAYAPMGKIFTPIPVMRWKKGQTLNQTLFDLQYPFFERILKAVPNKFNTLIASGDVLIRNDQKLPAVNVDADVICYGIWAEPNVMQNHGVFMIPKDKEGELDFMLQKPSIELQSKFASSHYALMDIGIWLLSDKAILKLLDNSLKSDSKLTAPENYKFYDLYSDFGQSLGLNPTKKDSHVESLKVSIIPLNKGEFYHFGTSSEMISSTLSLQNLVMNQRYIFHNKVKPHPNIFTQNSVIENPISEKNSFLWIENSYLKSSFVFTHHNIITGIPNYDFHIVLEAGKCVDIIPYDKDLFIVRPYGFNDPFKGNPLEEDSLYMAIPFVSWSQNHKISLDEWANTNDIQEAKIFPICNSFEQIERMLQFMCMEQVEYADEYLRTKRVSANDITEKANIRRIIAQRKKLEETTLQLIANNWENSIFYQLNLSQVARTCAQIGFIPEEIPSMAPLEKRIKDAMMRSEILKLQGNNDYKFFENNAFSLLQQSINKLASTNKVLPQRNVLEDQIVWGRSGVRIDLAGGWTDTPPYCLWEGGTVVNFSIELNGQQPLQVYIKPSSKYHIVCRSIDLGAEEIIHSYEELSNYNVVGSPFSIPKAALALCGFIPQYCKSKYVTLLDQLYHFGSGIEITLLSAIPAGSGLGTSSVLAATILGALSNFCSLGWDKKTIASRTFVLEQLLTSGGGWQDQYGGIYPGIKLLQSEAGMEQQIVVRELADRLFNDFQYQPCHLLYYTGITRKAKNILAEIVRGMFLNDQRLSLLAEMKAHALEMYDAIQSVDFMRYGKLVAQTWEMNKELDSGTNPPQIEHLCNLIRDYCLGYKLPGAGGGGFLYMVAKDPEAALKIKKILNDNPLTSNSRFVDMSISNKGLEISRS